jgi:thiol-disulfide isomerase/thioredoxin
MSDDTVRDALELLERSVTPPPEFADALFRTLAAEARSRQEPRGGGVNVVRRRHRVRRLVPVAAALVVVSTVATIVLVASGPETAIAVVRRAQSSLSEAPPFQATIAYDLDPERPATGLPQGARATIGIAYGGPTSYRQEILSEDPVVPAAGLPSVGSFIVWDGERLGFYRAAENDFRAVASRSGFEPLMQFSWDAPYPDWDAICARGDSEVLADAEIAGRATSHVRCRDGSGHSWELWVDRETGVVLKVAGAVGNDDVHPFATTDRGGFEVTSIRYQPEFEPGTFVVAAPPGATDLGVTAAPPSPDASEPPAVDDPYSHVRLTQGGVAPDWSGTLLGGDPVALRDLRGRPALVLFFADWCPVGDAACDVLSQFQQVYERWNGPVGLVTVDATATEAWGVDAVPIWVLLDEQGRTSDVRAGPQSLEELEDLLTAATAEGS